MDTISISESRPSAALAALHASAGGTRDYLFAGRQAQPDDLILVAWSGTEAVGYLAATDEGPCGLLIWEHLVLPRLRRLGIGQRLLQEAARRIPSQTRIVIDPLAELDALETARYYRRLGFRRQPPGTELWAPAALVVRAVRRRQGGRSESDTPVSVIVEGKAPGVVTVDPRAPVAHAVSLMNRHRIGALVVSSDGSRVEGILSERDVLVGLDQVGPQLFDQPVGSACTTDVLTATMSDPVATVMEMMTDRRIRHLPVTRRGRLAGIVSVGDFVLHRLYALESADLEHGGGPTDPTPNRPDTREDRRCE